MKCVPFAGFALCALLSAGAFAPGAHADEYNKLTIFSVNAPIEVPGYKTPMVLPAGTYSIKLLRPASGYPNIVQIYNKDQTHLYSTTLALPDYRLKPTGNTVLLFSERAEGSPQAIEAWFYPGDNYGQKFVYPKSRATELAKANNEAVLSMPDEASSNISKDIKSGTEPAAMAMEKSSVKAEEPNGQEGDASDAAVMKPPSNQMSSQDSNKKQ